MLLEALSTYGTKEGVGSASNPIILDWARETGTARDYTADSIPWCGLWMAVIAKRAGWDPVEKPLWAQNWLRFGTPVAKPGLGDILVYGRNGGGHVGLYVGEDATTYFTLGGNQGDQVSIVRIAKARLLGARRPIWKIAQPTNVRTIRLASGGTLSTNEA